VGLRLNLNLEVAGVSNAKGLPWSVVAQSRLDSPPASPADGPTGTNTVNHANPIIGHASMNV
jgi:hypothetical protein